MVDMKVTLEQIKEGTEEVIIRYRRMTDRVEGILKYLDGQNEKVLGWKGEQQCLIGVSSILYLESVDGATFFYTEKEMYRAGHSLALFESLYAQDGFFRCSKSMVINIYRIEKLKSMPGNRIDATMDNGEHIVISRRYAKELRSILKGETL